LKYNIKDIGVEGLNVSRRYGDSEVRLILKEAGMEVRPEPSWIEFDLELNMADPGILARGRVAAEFFITCGRCLGPARVYLEEPNATLAFLPQTTQTGEKDDQDLSVEDVDTFAHDGKELDLEPVLREMLVLAIPMAPLCKEECKGICSVCGAELNEESCGCSQEENPKAHWLEALARLKDSIKQ
jgi:uncharacterized protein